MTETFPRPLTPYEKLEYIHCTIQETMDGNRDEIMLETSLQFVEELREPYMDSVK
jgi:hypothetical protein